MEEIRAKINTLELLAKDYYTKGISDSEIEENNITDIFLDEIPFMLNDEVLSIGLTGATKSSKSTIMMLLVWWILRKYYHKDMDLFNICADQYEFGRRILDSEIKETIFGIDEFGELETTGMNSTIEQKYLEQFSDLQAQRNIARISCSPRKVFDQNARVIIRIIGKDSARFLTHCLIYYRIETPSYQHIQLVGRASFKVKPIMFEKNGWEELKKKYNKEWKEYWKLANIKIKKPSGIPTEEQQKLLNFKDEYGHLNEDGFFKYLQQKYGLREDQYGKFLKDVYRRYRVRKFKKMDLLNKEGIVQMREMTFAELYLKVFERIRPLIRFMRISRDMIEGKASMELKKLKIPYTIFTMEIVKTRVNSLVVQYNAIETMKLKKQKLRVREDIHEMNKAIIESTKQLQEELNSMNRLVELNREYCSI